MTLMGMTVPGTDRSSRWLLLGSLALNLFFIGIGGALLLQGYGASAPPQPSWSNRSMADRIARIVARLPDEDGERLQAAYKARGQDIETALSVYRQKQEAMRAALRAQPFDVDALRTAMADMRTARQSFDVRVHDFFAEQAAQMSPAGRQKLADWPGRRTEAGKQSNN
jgi:uncharacterized membrane protein